LLFAASAVALALAVIHFIGRLETRPTRSAKAIARQQLLDQQIAGLKLELQRDRPAIVARIRALQDEGRHAEAMNLASRYHLLNDPELLALYRHSAEIEARRQR